MASALSISGDKSRLIAHNLERVLGRQMSAGERRRRVAAVYDWYARYYVDSFRLPEMSPSEVDQDFSYSGFGRIEDAAARGQGVILALPHMGSWEWAAAWLCTVAKIPMTAVVEPLKPPELFDWFLGLRESLGMNIVAADANAGREASGALKRGEALCLPSDRDLTGTGVAVDFFGEMTTLPAGPATLALRTKSPLLPIGVYWRDGGVFGEVRPAIETDRRGKLRDDITRITRDLAHEFEVLIARAPEQWHMLSPNWPSDYKLLDLDVPDHLRGFE